MGVDEETKFAHVIRQFLNEVKSHSNFERY